MKKLLNFLTVGLMLIMVSCASSDKSESTGQYIDSAAITTKVKTQLAKSKKVSAFDVEVDTYKGVVTLSGLVDNEDQKDEAEEIAKNVKGVKDVENDIRVK